MSKGLEEFNKLKTWYILKMVEGNELLLRNNEKEMLSTIEKELKEGELAITYTHAIFDLFDNENNGDFIIDIIAKQKKALGIIKKKEVDVKTFKHSCKICDYDFYLKHNQNIMFGMTNELLTEDEFYLLKEVML